MYISLMPVYIVCIYSVLYYTITEKKPPHYFIKKAPSFQCKAIRESGPLQCSTTEHASTQQCMFV